MKPIKLTDAQMDDCLRLQTDRDDPEATGNRKCWHVIDTRDMVIENERLTFNQARQAACLPHRTYCRDGYKLVPCDGEAHENPHIDNCSQCAPRWGWVMAPVCRVNVCEDCKRELTHVEKTLLGALK